MHVCKRSVPCDVQRSIVLHSAVCGAVVPAPGWAGLGWAGTLPTSKLDINHPWHLAKLSSPAHQLQWSDLDIVSWQQQGAYLHTAAQDIAPTSHQPSAIKKKADIKVNMWEMWYSSDPFVSFLYIIPGHDCSLY